MTLFKDMYRIESMRLKNYDYSLPGIYFITICTKHHEHYFGKIFDGQMVLSEMGKIADLNWRGIPNHFQFVSLDEYIVMPNHIHGIILNKCNGKEYAINHEDAINRVSMGMGGITKTHNPMLNSMSLSKVIRWFKGRTTFNINNSENKSLLHGSQGITSILSAMKNPYMKSETIF